MLKDDRCLVETSRLLLGLRAIAKMPEEVDEWHAVELYAQVRAMAADAVAGKPFPEDHKPVEY